MVPLTTLEPISAGFRGRLEAIRLPSLLSVLEGERKTGLLDLRLDGIKARLHLRKGRVLRAHRIGTEGPRDAELIYHLIPASRGSFDFRPAPVAIGDAIRCSTSQLLLEGIRRMEAPAVDAEPPRRWLSRKTAVAALVTAMFVFAVIAGVWCTATPVSAPSASAR